MTTALEVEAQLTGPGGPFEVTREVIEGVEMKVYKDRFPSFGSSPIAAAHGDSGVHRLRRSTDTVPRVPAARQLGERTPRRPPAWATATGWPCCRPEQPRVVHDVLGHGRPRRGAGGPQRLVEDRRDRLRARGFRCRVLVADRKRFERVADLVDDIATLERVYLVDADPSEFGGGSKLHRFDELMGSPSAEFPETPIDEGDAAVIFYTSGTTGKPKGAVSTHRSMIANLQNTVFSISAGSIAMASEDSEGSGGQPVVAVHVAPLPRGRLPLHAGGRDDGRAEADHDRGSVRARSQRSPSSSGSTCRCGPRSPR